MDPWVPAYDSIGLGGPGAQYFRSSLGRIQCAAWVERAQPEVSVLSPFWRILCSLPVTLPQVVSYVHTPSKQALPPTQCHTSALSLKASRPMVLGETEARVNLLPVEAQLFVFCSLPPPVDSSKQKVVVLAYLTFWPGLDPPASTHLPRPHSPPRSFWPPPPRLVVRCLASWRGPSAFPGQSVRQVLRKSVPDQLWSRPGQMLA